MKTKSILLFTLAILAITANVKAQNIPNYIPTNGLVGWWPFNGNANDESGNGRNGAVNGATLGTDRFGNLNSSYTFDGTGNNIAASCNGFSNNQRTISLWFYANDIGLGNSGRTILGYGGNGTCGTSCLVVIDNAAAGGNKYEISGHCNNEAVYYNYGQTHPNNSWIHWTIVNNPVSGTSFYLNGQLVSNNSTYIQQTYTSNKNIYFGTAVNFSGNSPFLDSNIMPFNGRLDDIAIWNRALTQQEVTALYTASSTNNNATSNTTANVPGAISYQAVARDPQGMPLADANLQVRFTLIADSISGTAEYEETHTLSTNSLGLFTTAFGAGTPVSNTFGNINWTEGNKFVNVQIDAGNGWIDMGTQQLLSTPYSMHSATSGTIKNPGLPVFADNAAALAGGLVAGDMYRTASGDLKIVY